MQRSVHRVAVVTGTRAEFGLLESVLRAMNKRRGIDTRLIVTGMHLLPKFGRTIDQIRQAGWRVDATVKMQTGRDNPTDEPAAVARGIQGIARAVERLGCDIVLVLGDRIEAFAGACAASVGRHVLAHIHGGDRAAGDVDDVLRNAISRLAHVHLVASADAGNRLRRMGEPAGRIHRVGAPGLDDIRIFRQHQRKLRRLNNDRRTELLGPIGDRPYAVVVQHPCGQGGDAEFAIMNRCLTAVERCGLAGVVIYPNSDPGHEGIIRAIDGLKSRLGWCVFRSLARADYLRVASGSAVLIGNSSSGIIESASIGVCAVNVGDRQAGRLRCGSSVIDVGQSVQAIARGIRQTLKRARPTPPRSLYGDGRAGERIARVLERLIITPSFRNKQLTY